MDLANTEPEPARMFFRAAYEPLDGKMVFAKRFVYIVGGYQYFCPAKTLAEFLFAEHRFRYQAQLMDSAIESIEETSGEDTYQAEREWEDARLEQLQDIGRGYIERERTLFLKESAMTGILEQAWIGTQSKPTWYLSSGLVSECIGMGGCCTRGCGCCKKRLASLSRHGMSGHCSLACVCCQEYKGYFLDNDTVNSMDQEYKDALEGDNPFFLGRLASAFFDPLLFSDQQSFISYPTTETGDVEEIEDVFVEPSLPPPPYESDDEAYHRCHRGSICSLGR